MDIPYRFIRLRKLLRNPDMGSDDIRGEVLLSAEVIEDLKALESVHLVDTTCMVNNSCESVASLSMAEVGGMTAMVVLIPHALGMQGMRYFETMEEMVAKNPTAEPKKPYYVAELDHISDSDPASTQVAYYLQTVQFIEILKEISDHCEAMHPGYNLIFLLNEKLEIKTLYKPSDLQELTNLDELHDDITRSDDREKRQILLKSVLVDLLKNTQIEDRFCHLIEYFKVFVDRYQRSYQLYLCGFSFEKLRSEFEQERIEYITKINRAVTDIQDKIILLPLAYILIGGQFEKNIGVTIKNVFLLLASFLFLIMLHIILRNQMASLRSIGDSIRSIQDRFEKDHKDLFESLSEQFDDLDKIRRSQGHRLCLLLCIAWGVTIFSLIIFLYYSFPKPFAPVCSYLICFL